MEEGVNRCDALPEGKIGFTTPWLSTLRQGFDFQTDVRALKRSAWVDCAVLSFTNVSTATFSLFLMLAFMQTLGTKRTNASSGSSINTKPVVCICGAHEMNAWDTFWNETLSSNGSLLSLFVLNRYGSSATCCFILA